MLFPILFYRENISFNFKHTYVSYISKIKLNVNLKNFNLPLYILNHLVFVASAVVFHIRVRRTADVRYTV